MFKMRLLVSEILLIVTSISDIKYMNIDIRILAVALLTACLSGVHISVWGLIPGVILLIYSFCSNGKIGDGDGYIIATMGFINGFMNLMYVLFGAGILCYLGFTCIYLHKKLVCKTNTVIPKRLPFVPFLFVSYNIVSLTESIMRRI